MSQLLIAMQKYSLLFKPPNISGIIFTKPQKIILNTGFRQTHRKHLNMRRNSKPTIQHTQYTNKKVGKTLPTFLFVYRIDYFTASITARRFKYLEESSFVSPAGTTSTSTPAALRISATAFARASARPLLYSSEPIVSV